MPRAPRASLTCPVERREVDVDHVDFLAARLIHCDVRQERNDPGGVAARSGFRQQLACVDAERGIGREYAVAAGTQYRTA